MNNKTVSAQPIIHGIVIFLTSFIITSYSSVINPLSGDNSNDSWIFRYMGMLIDKGGIPYKDAFEQKGPLLFFIEYIGYKLNKTFGIWIIEFLSMSIFIFILFRLCKLFISDTKALICSIVSISSLSIFFSGNMCEEFALPFLALSLYIFTDYFLFKKINTIRLLACGACCGAIFMLRPNMLALWIVMSLSVIIIHIRDHKSFPVWFSFKFIFGFLLVISPIILWYHINDGLNDLLKQYFIFNYQYTDDGYTIAKHIKLMINFSSYSLLIIPIIILSIYIKDKKLRYFNITFIVFILLNLSLSTMSMRGFLHYGMPLTVCHAYPLALFTQQLAKNKNKLKPISYIIFILYSVTLLVFGTQNMISILRVCLDYKQSEAEVRMINEIKEFSNSEDRILVLGNGAQLYYEADRLCSSKYFIQVPIYSVNSSLKDDIKQNINDQLPILLVDYLSNDSDDPYGYSKLFEHKEKYEIIDMYNRLYILKE